MPGHNAPALSRRERLSRVKTTPENVEDKEKQFLNDEDYKFMIQTGVDALEIGDSLTTRETNAIIDEAFRDKGDK